MSMAGRTTLWVALAAALALSACSTSSADDGRDRDGGGIFGLFDGDDDEDAGDVTTQPGIGVNSFLWRASLDTLSFMPLASGDPFGGVIITDWYSDPAAPGERFKATVYILDTRLRADALNVSIFRQVAQNGQWADANVSPDTEIQIENAILRRARELRLGALGEE